MRRSAARIAPTAAQDPDDPLAGEGLTAVSGDDIAASTARLRRDQLRRIIGYGLLAVVLLAGGAGFGRGGVTGGAWGLVCWSSAYAFLACKGVRSGTAASWVRRVRFVCWVFAVGGAWLFAKMYAAG